MLRGLGRLLTYRVMKVASTVSTWLWGDNGGSEAWGDGGEGNWGEE